EALLEVEVHLQRERGLAAARRPVMWAEPHRQHRGRRDRPSRELLGDGVVPEQRVAVLDRRAARPDVAPLDREVGRLLVLHHVDEGDDVVGHGRGRRRGHYCAPDPARVYPTWRKSPPSGWLA